MTTRVSAVLRSKGTRVVVAAPDEPLGAVAVRLTENRIGAVPIVDDRRRVIGIVSERDIVRALAELREAALAVPAARVMSREVETCTPDDAVIELMEIMTRRRIRHLPVLDGGSLAGIVSIGDVVKQRLGEAQSEVEALRSYIVS